MYPGNAGMGGWGCGCVCFHMPLLRFLMDCTKSRSHKMSRERFFTNGKKPCLEITKFQGERDIVEHLAQPFSA